MKGYVSFGYIPPGVDILLFGALVGYSAYGGFGNNCLTNWYRDKGYGARDLMSALTVFVATGLLGLAAARLAWVNLVLIVVWLVIAVLIGRRYNRLAAATRI